MMNNYADFPVVRDIFAEASDILHQDLWKLAANGSDTELNAFQRDLDAGLFFQSDIPTGYGLGSSGALCASYACLYPPT